MWSHVIRHVIQNWHCTVERLGRVGWFMAWRLLPGSRSFVPILGIEREQIVDDTLSHFSCSHTRTLSVNLKHLTRYSPTQIRWKVRLTFLQRCKERPNKKIKFKKIKPQRKRDFHSCPSFGPGPGGPSCNQCKFER